MRHTPRSSDGPRDLVAGIVTLLLVPAAIGLPATAGATPRNPGDPVVRLRPDDGSVVRAAEVRLSGGGSRLETTAYSMVAATWRGSAPRIAVRTEPGTAWQRLPVLEDGPSVRPSGRAAEGDPGLHGTDLVWTGPAIDIDVRVIGSGHRDLELVLIDPGDPASHQQPSPARTSTSAAAEPAPRPDLRSRRDWGADNDLRNGRPVYLDRLRQVHVHHTATGNSYSRSDVPGIIRGMYRYHTQTLGWFDIGYNFLVDRFGRSWVGRSGGANRLVRGAHTLGFNHDSVGIAMIGTLTSRQPWRPAVGALVRTAAWKLDKHGRGAAGEVWMTSTGSDRYPDGRRVRLPVVDGHRDTNDTACPGAQLYDRLPAIRRRTQHRIDTYG